MKETWTPEFIQKQIIEIVTKELQGSISDDILKEVISDSGTDFSKAISFINKYKHGIVPIPLEEINWSDLVDQKYDNDVVHNIASTISIFNIIGFRDQYENQIKLLNDIFFKISYKDLRLIISYLINHKIAQYRGSFIWINDEYNGLQLDWYHTISVDKIKGLLQILKHENLASEYGKKIIKSTKHLQNTDFLETLIAETGIINDYNFINSSAGSHLIFYLIELMPEQIVDILYNSITSKSNEELIYLSDGRRYLVWALEKSSYRSETFDKTVEILYLLAKAENEDIANNATSKFHHLFQTYLSGTEATLEQRWAVLNHLIEKYSIDKIFIQALQKGLQTRNFIRDGEMGKQADKDFKDNIPSDAERNAYFERIINFLLDIFLTQGEYATKAEIILVEKFVAQYSDGDSNAIYNAISKILEFHGEISKDLKQQFAYIYEGHWDVTEENIQKAKDLEKRFSSTDIKGKLIELVKLAPFKHTKSGNEWIDLSKIEVAALAKQIISGEFPDFYENIIVLLEGEQRQTYNFGFALGGLLDSIEKILFISIEHLKSIPHKDQNISFIEGIINSQDSDKVRREAVSLLVKQPETEYHAIRISRSLKLQMQDMDLLRQVLESNKAYVTQLEFFNLKEFSDDEVVTTLTWLKAVSEYGNWVAIEMIYEVLKDNPERIKHLYAIACSLILEKGLLNKPTFSQFSSLYLKNLVEIIIENSEDSDASIFLAYEVIDYCKSDIIHHRSDLNYIVTTLLEQSWDDVWPIFGKVLVDESEITWYYLKEFLSKHKNYKVSKLEEWLKKTSPIGAVRMIDMVDFEATKDGEIAWSDLTKYLIDNFGEYDKVLSQLHNRLHSYFISGSGIPLFESRLKLVESLIGHETKQVSDFGLKEQKYFTNMIEEEKKRGDNYSLGYY